jgi:hypothetical protein
MVIYRPWPSFCRSRIKDTSPFEEALPDCSRNGFEIRKISEGQMEGQQQEHKGSLKDSRACKATVGPESNLKSDLPTEIRDPTFQT